ncbi:MAG: DUF2085 domain-containing protein [bacterium]|nr:DUF2085 domain-containing protein [bacterium]
MEELLYILGAAVCHQLPERSFFIAGHQLPICMRCSGTYLGAILTFFFLWFTGGLKRGGFPRTPIFFTLIAFPFLMGVDVVTVNLGFRPPSPEIKLLTGTFAGIFITSFLVPAFHTGFSGKFTEKPIYNNFLFVFIVIPVFAGAMLLTQINHEIVFYITAILENISILAIFTTLNLFIFLTIFEKRFPYPVSGKEMFKIPVPFSFIFTIIELGMIYIIRSSYLPPKYLY